MFGLFDLGKKKRQKVFTQLLEDAYYNHYDEILTNNDVYFEAGLKFAEENSESKPYKSDKYSIVFRYIINYELLSVYFSKSFDGGLIYSVKLVSSVEDFSYNNNSKDSNISLDEELEQLIKEANTERESLDNDGIIEKDTITYSNEQILTTAYNMIRETIEELNNKPLANNAPFLDWDETINLLNQDNGAAFIKLEDGTGYCMNFGEDKIVFIVKEKEGYPIFANQQFYEKYYDNIYEMAHSNNIENDDSNLQIYKYSDSKFEEEQLALAIQRSVQDNSSWVYLHTNLKESESWLIEDGWVYYQNMYIYPTPFENNTYKALQVKYDNNYFPILRAFLTEKEN